MSRALLKIGQMKGGVWRRSARGYALLVPTTDAAGRRKPRWLRYKAPPGTSPTEAEAQARALLARHRTAEADGTLVEPSRETTLQCIRSWFDKVSPSLRPSTVDTYRLMIENHVLPSAMANIAVQRLRPADIEAFYATRTLAPSSMGVLHSIVRQALADAAKNRLVVANVALSVDRRTRRVEAQEPEDETTDAQVHCWTAEEARAFLKAADASGVQQAAFYRLALDTGAREGELLGLTWPDVDLDAGTVRIARQLDHRHVGAPKWGPLKTKRKGVRVIPLDRITLERLAAHRRGQLAVRLANGAHYRDYGLVFAREAEHLFTSGAALGQALPWLTEGMYERVVMEAGVKRIKFHGLRHSTASILLAAGTPPHVVSKRLGHASVVMTLNVYAHALPNQQADAARTLGVALSGR